jgi:hypothetical protein
MNLSQFEIFQRNAVEAGVVFYHTGEFTSPIISAAAESLKNRIQETGAPNPTPRKLFSTFIEMAQNIHHYGVPLEQGEGGKVGSGTITVIKNETDFNIICVNRIETAQIGTLTGKLNALRAMTLDEIKQAYKQQLKNTDHATVNPDSKGAGLGWLTIARDAKEPLEFNFMSDPEGEGKYAYFLAKAVI